MRPVEQTKFAPPDGDCFAACVASVLEVSVADVPNFHADDWLARWNDWLAPLNVELVMTTCVDGAPHPCLTRGYALLGARSPRGDWNHAVVCRDGAIVWDPHPKRDMGVGEWIDWTVFRVIDPARPVGRPRPPATDDSAKRRPA